MKSLTNPSIQTLRGMRPETLSRLFSQWVHEGHVRGRGRVWELRDVEALRRLAEAVLRGS